jgi:hypothetical protein
LSDKGVATARATVDHSDWPLQAADLHGNGVGAVLTIGDDTNDVGRFDIDAVVAAASIYADAFEPRAILNALQTFGDHG